MGRFDSRTADERSPFVTAAKEFVMLACWLGSLFGLMLVGHGVIGT